MADKQQQLTRSERLFKAVSPWLGAVAFFVLMFYLLERNQDIPWYVFGLAGAMMGFGELLVQVNKIRKP